MNENGQNVGVQSKSEMDRAKIYGIIALIWAIVTILFAPTPLVGIIMCIVGMVISIVAIISESNSSAGKVLGAISVVFNILTLLVMILAHAAYSAL